MVPGRLKRVIQQLIENPLAQSILSGQFCPGAEIKGAWLEKGVVGILGVVAVYWVYR